MQAEMSDRVEDRVDLGVSERTGTPVDYLTLRPRLQQVRAAGAAVMLAAAVAGLALGVSWMLPRVIAFAVVTGDAIVHIRRRNAAIWVLIVDAIAFGLVIGLGGHYGAPAIALVSYLIAGAALLLPGRHVAWLLGVVTVVLTTRVSVVHAFATPQDDMVLATYLWGETAILVLAASLLLLRGASMVRSVQRRHDLALRAEQRASEMKNEFVSMISHELRTPLTTISGFTDTLRDSWRELDAAEVEEFLGIIATETDHLTNLVDDVLAIPRLEAGRLLLEPVDFRLQPAAFRIAELLFPAGGEASATVAIPGNVVVNADPNRVEQILRNLLDNARKYGGDHVGIEAIRRGSHYLVVVADNGPGVPAGQRERIFDRFEQVEDTSHPTSTGIGLGLTLTRHLVNAMGGEVWYEPGFPVGARFCFTLPAGRLKPEPTEPDRAATAQV
jgi:signal transduction histidine kinase